MKKIILGLYHHALARQFVKFCLVGLTNFIVDISVYFILTRVFYLYYLVAAVGSFIVAVSWSFYMNRRWTFRHYSQDISAQYIKFFMVNIIAMAFNLSLLYFMVDYLSLYDLIAKFLASMISVTLSFSLSRFWAFKDIKSET